jgi:predicted Zn-dependent protease
LLETAISIVIDKPKLVINLISLVTFTEWIAMGMIENFEKMLAGGKDSPLLRFSLGNEYMKADDAAHASDHLRAAVALDPGYSAAWKLLGKALAQLGDDQSASEAYRQGISAAEAKGDKQAAKEMTVFLKRLQSLPKG